MLLIEAVEFGSKNCFEMVQEDFEITGNMDENEDNVKKFVAHECFQSVVADIWSGLEYHQVKLWQFYIYLFFGILFSPILLILYFPYYVINFILPLKVIILNIGFLNFKTIQIYIFFNFRKQKIAHVFLCKIKKNLNFFCSYLKFMIYLGQN